MRKLARLRIKPACSATKTSWSLQNCQVYGKCSIILKTFLFPFSNLMLAIRAEIHKTLVRIANSENHDQTASGSTMFMTCLGLFIRQLVFTTLEQLP